VRRNGFVLVLATGVLLVAGATLLGNIRRTPGFGADDFNTTWPTKPERLPPGASAIPPGFGAATWALDPAFAAPDASSTEVHILVWERECSSGRPTTGRMSAPAIEYQSTTVTIEIGVRPRAGQFQTCPLPPGTPALVTLDEPLSNRTLLDGGRTPISPPSPLG
jgi:hypothetical protein